MKVVVAESDPETGKSLRQALEESGHVVAAVLNSEVECLDEAIFTTVDVAIIDLEIVLLMKRYHTSFLDELAKMCSVVVSLDTARLFDAIFPRLPISGLLFRDTFRERCSDVVELARHGLCVVPAELVPAIATNRLRLEALACLPAAEHKVLELLGRAKANKEIAEELSLPESMVKALVRSVLYKLRLRNRTEAAVFAARYGISAGGPARQIEQDEPPAQYLTAGETSLIN